MNSFQLLRKRQSKLKRIVRDPSGPFRMRVVRDKTKYTRKTKHKCVRSSDG